MVEVRGKDVRGRERTGLQAGVVRLCPRWLAGQIRRQKRLSSSVPPFSSPSSSGWGVLMRPTSVISPAVIAHFWVNSPLWRETSSLITTMQAAEHIGQVDCTLTVSSSRTIILAERSCPQVHFMFTNLGSGTILSLLKVTMLLSKVHNSLAATRI